MAGTWELAAGIREAATVTSELIAGGCEVVAGTWELAAGIREAAAVS